MQARHLIAAAIIRDRGRLALVRNRWPIGEFWGLPGGRLEPGESVAEAVVREVREETGLVVAPETLAYILDYYNQRIDYHIVNMVFTCRLLGGTLQAPLDDEFVAGCAWVDEQKIPAYMVWPQYRDPLLAYLEGSHHAYYVDKDAFRPEEWVGRER